MATPTQIPKSLFRRIPRQIPPLTRTPPITRRSNTNYICARCLSTSPISNAKSRAPRSRDRGPPSKEDTQTDFAAMNVLGNTPPPATGIDATTEDGFAFSNNTRVSNCGVLLVGGEVFRWSPSPTSLSGQLRNAKGQWEPALEYAPWGLLEVVHPKPDLLIVGTGRGITPISPSTRSRINALGIRIEVQDTRNAASQYNLLATERGIGQVAALLVPVGWKEAKS